ncbi:MAG: ISAzo13 family transposase [Flavobacteriaceae bacterium]|nr:ISAzo13 family transposase [Flavobacteriaceae bacterium]
MKHAEILDEFIKIVDAHKAGSPMNKDAVWTYLSRTELSHKLKNKGFKASNYIILQCLKYFKLGKRKLQKTGTIKTVENRDMQFKNINKFRQYENKKESTISIDSKKKEDLGFLYREGKNYTSEGLNVFDHDFANLSSGKVVPHGLYDMTKQKAFINLSLSKDTSKFCKFCIKQWWGNHGKNDYPDATSILVLCDGGGSNSSRHYVFKEAMFELANELNIEIRIAHYPPYCSKYNPIEHKLFPHITRAWSGIVLDRVVTMKNLILERVANNNIKEIFVNICDKIYETGKKASEKFMENMPVIFDELLPRWNYKFTPVKE